MNKLCCYINVQFKLISHPYKIKQWLHAHMAALALPLVYNIPWRQAVHVLELCLFPFFYHNLLTVTLRNEWVHVWYRWIANRQFTLHTWRSVKPASKTHVIQTQQVTSVSQSPLHSKETPPDLVWVWLKTRILFCVAVKRNKGSG